MSGTRYRLTPENIQYLIQAPSSFGLFRDTVMSYIQPDAPENNLFEAVPGDILIHVPRRLLDIPSTERTNFFSLFTSTSYQFSEVFLPQSSSIPHASSFINSFSSYPVESFRKTVVFILKPEHRHLLTWTDYFSVARPPFQQLPSNPSL